MLSPSVRRRFSRAAFAPAVTIVGGVGNKILVGVTRNGEPHTHFGGRPWVPAESVDTGVLVAQPVREHLNNVLVFLRSVVSSASKVSFKRFSGVSSSRAAFSWPPKSAKKSASGARSLFSGIGDRGRTRRGLDRDPSSSSRSSRPTNLTGRARGFFGRSSEAAVRLCGRSCSASGSRCFRIDFFRSGDWRRRGSPSPSEDLLPLRPAAQKETRVAKTQSSQD